VVDEDDPTALLLEEGEPDEADEPAEDPVDRAELARRLVEEAKRTRNLAAGPRETPQELARRLVAETKQKMKLDTAPPPPPEEVDAEAVTRIRPRPAEPAPRPSLKPAAKPAAPPAAKPAAPQPPAARPTPPPPAPKKPLRRPDDRATRTARAVTAYLPTARVEDVAMVRDREGFRATWRAHRAQAARTGNVALLGTASALLYAADTAETLVSARMTLEGTEWACWVDLERSALLAFARPADSYLED
jgi:hypothetical protein